MTTSRIQIQEYPFTPNYLQLDHARMHYVDVGEGPAIVFVHGTPSWSFEFRAAISYLSKHYRCIALDHIGFGLSDKPETYAYTLDQHVSNLKALIRHLQLSHFSMVLHDFGGPIGLRVASEMPQAVNTLILANTWCFSAEQEPEFIKMRRILRSPLLPFLYRRLNFSAKFLLPAAFGNASTLTKAIHRQYTARFSKASERNGTLAFARSLLNDQSWFAETGERCAALRDTPVLFLWGLKDRFITEKYLHKMRDLFANNKVVTYANAGHFVFEEMGNEAAMEIERFLQQ